MLSVETDEGVVVEMSNTNSLVEGRSCPDPKEKYSAEITRFRHFSLLKVERGFPECLEHTSMI